MNRVREFILQAVQIRDPSPAGKISGLLKTNCWSRSAQDDNQGTIASLRMTTLFCHPEGSITPEGSRF